ncbi:MAG: NAD(P)/FAD-dependent oxidoreductase [Candidatus Altiarchaeota archaeon]|nr:NAD(P)/FAD-dependent oxidoreductase [Candidatus Altiarchaeota archaeon]
MNIIGGGPVGLYTAYLLAKGGHQVTVHEEHRRIGKPEHCTGIVSRNLWDMVKPDSEAILETLQGAHFYAKDEHAFLERKNKVDVLNRTVLDRQLAEMAQSEGAKVERGKRVSWESFDGLVVAADGATSQTRYDFGQSVDFLPALQFDLRERAAALCRTCELWYGPWAPDFFAWVVPHGNRVRVGMAAQNLQALKSFVLKRFGRLRVSAQHSGLVITGGPVAETYFKQRERDVVLVGDAAGHVKPTTGGGVVMGLRGAKHLIENIDDLPSYQLQWNKDFGGELRFQKLAMKVILRKPEAFVRFLVRSKGVIEVGADMEMQSKIVFKNLPSVFRLGLDLMWPK